MSTKALKQAIKQFGSQTALANAMGIGQGHISKWLLRNKKVPIANVPKISKVTGIPAWKFRPDLPDLFPHDC